jgi:sodium-dependent dicarboxylate transporter 2/3/5
LNADQLENQGTTHSPTVREQLSPAEERFESIRRKSGFVLAPLLFLVVLLLPMRGISQEAHELSAVVVLVAALWITEAIPIPAAALLGPAICVLMGVAPVKTVFMPFADPVVFLFIGSFILAQAMFQHKLDRRIAVSILALKWVGLRPLRILAAFGAVTAFISMWVSNTATTAMMYPIGLSLLAALSATHDTGKASSNLRLYGSTILLLCAYASSLGGLGTPVGTPPNLIGLGMIEQATGVRISFFQFMALTFPIMALLFLFLIFHVGRKAARQFRAVENFPEWIRTEKRALGSWSRGEKNTAIAFACTTTLWVLPGLLMVILGKENPLANFLSEHFPESIVALIGGLMLFVLPIDFREHRFTLSWKEAVQIDWGTILLFGGGLSLGGLMFSTGLAEAVGHGLETWTGAHSIVSITFLATGLGVIITEFCSNTATANVIIPIAIGLAQANGLSPVLPALGACLGTSMAFLLPVSTPPNAIVYGSGLVPITRMIRYGFVMDIVAMIVVPATLLLWGPLVLGG